VCRQYLPKPGTRQLETVNPEPGLKIVLEQSIDPGKQIRRKPLPTERGTGAEIPACLHRRSGARPTAPVALEISATFIDGDSPQRHKHKNTEYCQKPRATIQPLRRGSLELGSRMNMSDIPALNLNWHVDPADIARASSSHPIARGAQSHGWRAHRPEGLRSRFKVCQLGDSKLKHTGFKGNHHKFPSSAPAQRAAFQADVVLYLGRVDFASRYFHQSLLGDAAQVALPLHG